MAIVDIDHSHQKIQQENEYYSHQLSFPQYKEAGLNSLKELNGWCTEFKAGVLMDLIHTNNPKVIVEIGVFGGSSLVPMAYALKANRSGVIYGIDPWSPAASEVGMEGVNKEWWGNLDHQKVLEHLQQKLKAFRLNKYVQLIRTTSEEAKPIKNIDMLHIDGNHSEQASMLDVLKWVPLVRSGGLIVFDDITWGTTDKAVKWLNENCIQVAEFNDTTNSWAIWKKP